MSIDINNMTQENLANLPSHEMIQLVLQLKEENDKLREATTQEMALRYDERLEQIERDINLTKQYMRRDSIEVSGVPLTVNDADVENEVIKILKTAKAKVGNRFPGPFDVQAAHRKGKKGVIIVKFTNRKFARSALVNSRNLKDHLYKPAGDNAGGENDAGARIYINESLCPEFGYLHFAVRKAKQNNEIHRFKVRNGVMNIQKVEDGPFEEVSHVNDLTKFNLTVPPRRN